LSEFELLKSCLTAERGATDYAAFAKSLDIQPASARSNVQRLQQRFRELFRAEVAVTVDDPADVDAEMQVVIASLRQTHSADLCQNCEFAATTAC
jgi:RNA polymerase sigma-70 factor (ECF subfamily)